MPVTLPKTHYLKLFFKDSDMFKTATMQKFFAEQLN